MYTTQHLRLRRMMLCALFTALTAVCSQIALPMPWGIPVNLALFAVYLAGVRLGPVWGAVSQLVYLGLAAVGVPVMAELSGGPAALFGRTGGYAIGYLAAALITGALAARRQTFLRFCLAMAAGCAGCYALGTVWFMAVSGIGLWQSLTLCVLPFLPGDAVKILLAAWVGVRLRRALPGGEGGTPDEVDRSGLRRRPHRPGRM